LEGVLRTNEAAPRRLAARLVGFQMSAFLAMELLERIASGGGTQHLPLLLIGLPVQALIAVLDRRHRTTAAPGRVRDRGFLSRPPAWSDTAITVLGASVEPRRPDRTGSPPGRAPPSFLVTA
jgi:hypothetical protein